MKTRIFLSFIVAFILISSILILPSKAQGEETSVFSHTDLFGVGIGSDMSNPMLFRMNKEGTILWERSIDLPQLALEYGLADRNIPEDAFYMNVSYYGWNKLDGNSRIQKYDESGLLVWEVGLAPGGGTVSADPLQGGIYATAADMGVYKLDKDGNVIWGPNNFGITSPCSSSGGPVYWGAFTDVITGGAYLANGCIGAVLKIDKDGNEVWRVPIPDGTEGLRLTTNPLDGGTYVGSGGYARHTHKLDPNGNIEWSKYFWPSYYTYQRTVSPVDGSLFISTGWPALLTRVLPNGTVIWSVPNDNGAGFNVSAYGLAADIEEDYFYTGDGYRNLGVSKFNGTNVITLIDPSSLIWHVDPGYYTYNGGYGPRYTIYTGVPAQNQSPVANAGGPYFINEGDTLTLDASGSSDPDNNIVNFEWDLDNDGEFDDAVGVSPEVSFEDNGDYIIGLKVWDSYDEFDTTTGEITVANVSPTIHTITGVIDPILVGTLTETSATFSDPGVLDSHSATWHWGDTTTTPGIIEGNNVTGAHTYSAPGVYTISLIVTDDDAGSANAIFQYLVVYDPNGGFVTGGGWIVSPINAYKPDPTLSGKATFGFVSKYKKGAAIPSGNTEFQFQAGDLNFHSSTYDWLVVNQSGKSAQFKGKGTINGALDLNGNFFKFMLWAGDGSPDTFRIKIWSDENEIETIIYDNGFNQSVEGGSIVVHSGK